MATHSTSKMLASLVGKNSSVQDNQDLEQEPVESIAQPQLRPGADMEYILAASLTESLSKKHSPMD